ICGTSSHRPKEVSSNRGKELELAVGFHPAVPHDLETHGGVLLQLGVVVHEHWVLPANVLVAAHRLLSHEDALDRSRFEKHTVLEDPIHVSNHDITLHRLVRDAGECDWEQNVSSEL